MRITIESTEDLTTIDGVPVRAWRGTTDGGVACTVFVHRLAVRDDRDTAQFERELKEMAAPAEMARPAPLPLRMVL